MAKKEIKIKSKKASSEEGNLNDLSKHSEGSEIEETTSVDTSVAESADEVTSVEDDYEQQQAEYIAQLEELQEKITELQGQLLRQRAETENIQKRLQKRADDAYTYSIEKFANEMLNIVDSLERGIESANCEDEHAKLLKEGMELTLKMFLDSLEKFNIACINPKNETFNPSLHEAISMQEAEGCEAGEIIAVVQNGYTLKDRLLRPARVVVAKASEKQLDAKA